MKEVQTEKIKSVICKDGSERGRREEEEEEEEEGEGEGEEKEEESKKVECKKNTEERREKVDGSCDDNTAC